MEATQMAHWPGKDTPVCDTHATALSNLANMMGFRLHLTPYSGICINCIHEKSKEIEE